MWELRLSDLAMLSLLPWPTFFSCIFNEISQLVKIQLYHSFWLLHKSKGNICLMLAMNQRKSFLQNSIFYWIQEHHLSLVGPCNIFSILRFCYLARVSEKQSIIYHSLKESYQMLSSGNNRGCVSQLLERKECTVSSSVLLPDF